MNVLITGSNRSGTTWVGEVLKRGLNNTKYLYEPMAKRKMNKCVKGHFPLLYHFHYIKEEEYTAFKTYFDHMMGRNPYSLNKLIKYYGLLGLGKYIKYELQSGSSEHVIIKDPLALFSSETLYRFFDTKTIVLKRNPYAYVHSILRKGWRSNPAIYLSQMELVKNLFNDKLIEELEAFFQTDDNVLEEAVLRWKIYHSVISKYEMTYSGKWLFVKHENLVENPLGEFEKIVDYLGITPRAQMNEFISYSTKSNTKIDPNRTHNLIRNSKQELDRWTMELNSEQKKYIGENTQELLQSMYPELL